MIRNACILPTGALVLMTACVLAACGGASGEASTSTTPRAASAYDRVPRLRFNQLAMRRNLPVYWAEDADEDGAIDPGEVRSLRFYPTEVRWVRDGQLTEEFDRAYRSIVEASRAPEPTDPRRAAVVRELDGTAPTLIENDLSALPQDHRDFARRMLRVAELIDRLYARQVGMEAMEADVDAADPASQSLFRRNWGPRCRGATTESDPSCSAIEGAPPQRVDVYPVELQQTEGFCQTLEQHERSEALLTPFTVVREREGELTAVPYTEAYRELMRPIAEELRAAAAAIADEDEEPLRRYLRAAADAFESNDWDEANEAWAAMSVRNSSWYVRVGPDEVYWDPCSHKAGFHLTFARINQGSLEWQDRLSPLQARMERSLAELSGGAYEARDVSFHLPDFIDIVVNAGDDRDPFGATIGQSLPNWGPVADEGRGRTVAMTNLYTDPDSLARGREVARSLLTEEAMAHYTDDTTPGLLSTILHEATHNLGPSHDYEVDGQTDNEAFGGGLASMLEELKAQSGALYFVDMLREEGILTEEQARQVYLNSVIWALGHISRGMYTPSGQRKAYSQLAAVQVGFLMDRGVLEWDPEAMAANGSDRGAFSLDYDDFAEAAEELMQTVVRLKATADREAAEELADRYVDGDRVPQATIRERYQRSPRTTFVYSLRI